MPQQINLHRPTLLSPQRAFPAVAMLRALALWALVLGGVAGWTLWRGQAQLRELAPTEASRRAEHAQLTQALRLRLPASGPTAALQQELNVLEQRLAERQRLAFVLGDASADDSPTPWLRSLGEGLPDTVWLHEVAWAPGSRELAGHTLRTEDLQAWLARQGPAPQALRVEQKREGPQPVWAFRLRLDNGTSMGSGTGSSTGSSTGSAPGADGVAHPSPAPAAPSTATAPADARRSL